MDISLQDFFDTAPDLFLSIDAQTFKIIVCNKTLLHKTFYSKEEIINESVLRIFEVEHHNKLKSSFKLVAKGKEITGQEFRIRCKDGSNIDVMVSITTVRDERGKIIRYRTILRDITIFKERREERLKALVTGTYNVLHRMTGDHFFESLASHVAQAFNVKYVMIGECSKDNKDNVHVFASWINEKQGKPFELSRDETPWKNILGGAQCFYPKDVTKEFPKDQLLRKLKAKSFVGVPFYDSFSRMIGGIVVFDTAPMEEDRELIHVLKIFAGRTGAELERTQADKALQESEERLSLAMDTVRMCIWDWDVVKNKIKWSGYHYELLGAVEQAFDGSCKSFFKYVHPDDRKAVNSAIDSSLKKNGGFNIQFRIVQPCGEIRWMTSQSQPYYDSKNNVVRMVGILQDITKRQEALLRLEKSEQNFRHIIESFISVVCVHDGEKILFINKVGLKLLGVSENERERILGEPVMQFVHPHYKDIVKRRIATVLKDRMNTPFEKIKLINVTGDNVDIETTSVPVVFQGEDCVLALAVDITEINKAKKDLLQKDMTIYEVMDKVERAKDYVKNNVKENVANTIMPVLIKYKSRSLPSKHIKLVIENLQDLTSDYSREITSPKYQLTRREIEICNLIKHGYQSKEIMTILNIGPETIHSHRQSIRRKLKLERGKTLVTLLQELSE